MTSGIWILASLRSFTSKGKLEDDQTLVVVRYQSRTASQIGNEGCRLGRISLGGAANEKGPKDMKALRTTVSCICGVTALGLSAYYAMGQSPTPRVVSAANAFLATLTENQRQHALYAFDDEAQRARWSNLPVGMVPRGGIALKDMTSAQRSAAMALLSSALSPRGFEKVQQIMEGDEANKNQEANGRGGAKGRGGPSDGFKGKGGPPDGKGKDGKGRGGGDAQFGKDNYYISILGTPSETTPWMLQFGGHHLAVNMTISGTRGVITPTLTGAQPALFTLDGKTVRPLGPESDKAAALLNALDHAQRKPAVLGLPQWPILCSVRGKMARPFNRKVSRLPT